MVTPGRQFESGFFVEVSIAQFEVLSIIRSRVSFDELPRVERDFEWVGVFVAEKVVERLPAVSLHDLQLDGTIKQRIAAAIAALGTITVPFGQAIIEQPVQVHQAIDAINALSQTLDNDLLPLVQQQVD